MSITRQNRHTRARRAAGLCAGCGTESQHYRCPACRATQRKAKGFTPKRPNGPGRPVLA